MELIFDTEYTDGTKAEAHRVPCGTWESTEADAHVQFKNQNSKIRSYEKRKVENNS